jgi:hypothetical protein
VRREGPERRFVYIAVGVQAGQHSTWSRRMKIDVHTIAKAMIDEALKGMILEAVINGTGNGRHARLRDRARKDLARRRAVRIGHGELGLVATFPGRHRIANIRHPSESWDLTSSFTATAKAMRSH